MAKGFTQITFDFGAPPVKDVVEQELISSEEQFVLDVATDVDIPDEQPAVIARIKSDTKIKSTRGRRSLKDIALSADLIQVPDDETLFKKQYYSIGEVAVMFREKQSLIRYWETEFDLLKPRKNKKGDRFFRPVDIKNLLLIYDLLRRRKFTIEGAKDYLKKEKKAEEKFEMIQSLKKIREFFLELKAQL